MNPAGAMTGKLFPTGKREDTIVVREHSGTAALEVRATLVDAGNPFVLVDASTLPIPLIKTLLLQQDTLPLSDLNNIRCEAAVMMGLAASIEQARLTHGTPKIAMVLSPSEAARFFPEEAHNGCQPDVSVISLSMGKLHPSLQLTGAVAISAAFSVPGTVPFRLAHSNTHGSSLTMRQRLETQLQVCIAHRSGTITVTVDARSNQSEAHIEACSVSRTARTLFEGQVWFCS